MLKKKKKRKGKPTHRGTDFPHPAQAAGIMATDTAPPPRRSGRSSLGTPWGGEGWVLPVCPVPHPNSPITWAALLLWG